MANDKLRRQIAFEAARMMYVRQESEYYRAKMKAARRICQGWVKPADLPSNREVREQLQMLARTSEGEQRTANLRDMRLEALRVMHILQAYHPRLIGPTLSGHVRRGSDIELQVFADNVSAVTGALDAEGIIYEAQRPPHLEHEQVFTHLYIRDRFSIELTICAADLDDHVFKTAADEPVERASIAELEAMLAAEAPPVPMPDTLVEGRPPVDRFQIYRTLLLPLETVKENPQYHPEEDALYHSLQVYTLARDAVPYDEELQLAALLHDVGKAIDPYDYVAAALEALDGTVTQRTAWLIEHHVEAAQLREGTLGIRARRRLETSPDFDDLMLLCDCDRQGRVPGVTVPDVDDALDDLRELARTCGG